MILHPCPSMDFPTSAFSSLTTGCWAGTSSSAPRPAQLATVTTSVTPYRPTQHLIALRDTASLPLHILPHLLSHSWASPSQLLPELERTAASFGRPSPLRHGRPRRRSRGSSMSLPVEDCTPTTPASSSAPSILTHPDPLPLLPYPLGGTSGSASPSTREPRPLWALSHRRVHLQDTLPWSISRCPSAFTSSRGTCCSNPERGSVTVADCPNQGLAVISSRVQINRPGMPAKAWRLRSPSGPGCLSAAPQPEHIVRSTHKAPLTRNGVMPPPHEAVTSPHVLGLNGHWLYYPAAPAVEGRSLFGAQLALHLRK